MRKTNSVLKSLLLLSGVISLASCGGGSGGGGDNPPPPQNYKLGMSYSTTAIADSNGQITLPIQVKNYSTSAMNGISYSITGLSPQGTKLNAVTASVSDSSCTNVAAGADCHFVKNIAGVPGATYKVNWEYGGQTSGTTANVSVVDTPVNDGVGIDAISLYYPQATVQNPDGTSSIVVLAYMSEGVYAKDSATNFNSIKFTDSVGNDLHATVIAGNNSGDNAFVGGEAVTFLLTAPRGANSLTYKIETIGTAGATMQTSDPKTVKLVAQDDPQGVLVVSPSIVSLDENHPTQTLYFQNIGNGSVNSLNIKPQDASKITVGSNSCGASLKVGQSCNYQISLNLPAVKLTKGSTGISASYSDAATVANVKVNYRGQDATAGMDIKNTDSDNPDMFDFTYLAAPDSKNIRITNTGENAETIADFAIPAGFAVAAPTDGDTSCNLPLVGQVLQPTASCSFSLVYSNATPTQGPVNGNMTITYNYPSLNGQNATTNTGVVLSYETVPPQGLLRIEPQEPMFDPIFGNTKDSNTKVLKFTNIGNNTASNIISALTSPIFSKAATTCGSTLQIGESCTYTVKFGTAAANYVGNESALLNVKYIAYNQIPATTSATLQGTVLAPNSAKLTPSTAPASITGFAGGTGVKTDPLMIMQGASAGKVTFNVTNTGLMTAESFYVSSGALGNTWTIDNTSTCATSKATSTSLDVNASCSVVLDAVTTVGTGSQNLDLSGVTANWSDDANLSGTSAALVGANTVYTTVYLPAQLVLQGKPATTGTVKVVQGNVGTNTTWNLINGYNEPDHLVTFMSTDPNITVTPNCTVSGTSPICSPITVKATSSATTVPHPDVIGASIAGTATVSPTKLSVNVFAPMNFLVGGGAGTINLLTSNGSTSTLSNVLYPKVTYQATAFGDGKYVSVGESGAIITSTDGINWVGQKSGTTNTLFAIAFGQGKFIAAGNNIILSSTDGVNWGIVKSDTGVNQWIIKNLVYDNTNFIATGVNCPTNFNTMPTCMNKAFDNYSNIVGLYMYSSNGSSWTNSTAPGYGGVVSMVTTNGTTYAINSQYLVTSSDGGVTWSKIIGSGTSGTGMFGSGFSYYNNKYNNQTSYANYVYSLALSNGTVLYTSSYANNGINVYKLDVTNAPKWVSLTSSASNYSNLSSMACNGLNCVATLGQLVSNNPSSYTTATLDLVANKVTWGNNTILTGGIPTFGIALNGSQFMLAGANGINLLSSNNGSTWTGNANPMAQDINGIAYNNGNTFVAVAGAGNILTSTNKGTTWGITTPTGANLFGVAYGAGKFVVVGDQGTILSSTDGLAWNPATTGTNSVIFRSVTYSPAGFVAVGSNGATYTSIDGTSWTSAATYSNSTLYSVAAGNNLFALGGTNALYSGSNIASLANKSTIANGITVRSVIYGDMFYAAGFGSGNNSVLSSTDGQNWTNLAATGLNAGNVYGLAFGGGSLVAVGQSTVAFSDDGVLWDLLPVDQGLWNIVYYTAVGFPQ